MSLKQEIETWVEALAQYDGNEFENSLKTFDGISDTSKILFNCGVIHATLGEHDKAVECYQRATRLDQYLAVAYFQQGVSNFLVGDFEEALANFNDTLLYLRGNTYIDYEQLGLKFKLFSCEVLFNRGLCYIYLQQKEAGMGDLTYAVKEKVTPDHDVIDEAIREEADGYTVFSIPVGVVYRPNSAKVKNLKTKDYLGKARLIASSEKGNTFTGFQGSEIKRNMGVNVIQKDDRPPDSISFAASNLVRSDLSSRSQRQQSAPPINRNMFPPTPPPEEQARPALSSTRTAPAASNAASHPPPNSTTNATSPPPFTSRANSVRTGGPLRMNSELNRKDLRDQDPRRDPRDPDLRRDVDFRRDPDNDRRGYGPETRGSERRVSDDPISPKSSFQNQNKQLPRIGTTRTASEPRGGPSRQYSNARPDRGYPGQSGQGRGRLFMEALPSSREEDGENVIDEYPDELYDLYNSTAHSNPYTAGAAAVNPARRPSERTRQRSPSRQRSAYPMDDGDISPSNHSSLDDFEILNNAGGDMSRPREASRSRGTSRSRRPVDVRTIRVKVRLGEDTRYLMVSTTVMFDEFLERVREKLNLRGGFKIKTRDEGDLITMGDRDDWEMAVQTVRREARKAAEDMGKMEVWIQLNQ